MIIHAKEATIRMFVDGVEVTAPCFVYETTDLATLPWTEYGDAFRIVGWSASRERRRRRRLGWMRRKLRRGYG